MTGQPEHVLIIGAGLGGLRTAEQLRAAGFAGRISLVGAEPHLPYDRPPLSKQVLAGVWEPDRITLGSAERMDDLGVRTHLGTPAVALRPGEVELADGATLHGDAVVIATGLVARRWPGQPAHVPTLRTLEDALALRATLERVGSLLIVGAGFIGAEVATAARARGIAVTVLEALPVPAARALGAEIGALDARLFTEAGVDLRTGVRVQGFQEAGPRVAVELDDGSVLDADAGLVAIGAAPRLDWLDGFVPPDFDPAGELRCDARGRVLGWDRVWAVGDVAIWDDPRRGDDRYPGDPIRHEHWTSAGEQAAVVARDVLGVPPPPTGVPYFWSDQFGLKIQLFGWPEPAEEVLPLHGTGLDGGPVRGTVAGYLAGGRLVAVVGFGAARHAVGHRALVAAGASRAEVLERASG